MFPRHRRVQASLLAFVALRADARAAADGGLVLPLHRSSVRYDAFGSRRTRRAPEEEGGAAIEGAETAGARHGAAADGCARAVEGLVLPLHRSSVRYNAFGARALHAEEGVAATEDAVANTVRNPRGGGRVDADDAGWDGLPLPTRGMPWRRGGSVAAAGAGAVGSSPHGDASDRHRLYSWL